MVLVGAMRCQQVRGTKAGPQSIVSLFVFLRSRSLSLSIFLSMFSQRLVIFATSIQGSSIDAVLRSQTSRKPHVRKHKISSLHKRDAGVFQ